MKQKSLSLSTRARQVQYQIFFFDENCIKLEIVSQQKIANHLTSATINIIINLVYLKNLSIFSLSTREAKKKVVVLILTLTGLRRTCIHLTD